MAIIAERITHRLLVPISGLLKRSYRSVPQIGPPRAQAPLQFYRKVLERSRDKPPKHFSIDRKRGRKWCQKYSLLKRQTCEYSDNDPE